MLRLSHFVHADRPAIAPSNDGIAVLDAGGESKTVRAGIEAIRSGEGLHSLRGGLGPVPAPRSPFSRLHCRSKVILTSVGGANPGEQRGRIGARTIASSIARFGALVNRNCRIVTRRPQPWGHWFCRQGSGRYGASSSAAMKRYNRRIKVASSAVPRSAGWPGAV